MWRKMLEELRREQHRFESEPIEKTIGREVEPLNQLIQKEEAVCVQEAVESLPDHYKAAIKARYFEDRSSMEVAQELGLKCEAFKSRVFRAKIVLRESLNKLSA